MTCIGPKEILKLPNLQNSTSTAYHSYWFYSYRCCLQSHQEQQEEDCHDHNIQESAVLHVESQAKDTYSYPACCSGSHRNYGWRVAVVSCTRFLGKSALLQHSFCIPSAPCLAHDLPITDMLADNSNLLTLTQCPSMQAATAHLNAELLAFVRAWKVTKSRSFSIHMCCKY